MIAMSKGDRTVGPHDLTLTKSDSNRSFGDRLHLNP